ncbi:phage tail protein [Sphingobacterium tabacisoli]|uniref:Phage tail protein n=1 Tax=Sphingobacterium tabacisoli TaxID=2044855 RepID=A0ABW5L612_9SPHI|nr:tail fiber protein [Sphingobacterium tabacisoli]
MDGTIGEIRMFAGNFPPYNWAFCNGQIIAIASNTALFSILGTTYGGNGQSTFGLPNLAGRTVIGSGNGPGLTPRISGEAGGTNIVTLNTNEIPSHTHGLVVNGAMKVSSALADIAIPTSGLSLAKTKYVVDKTDVPIVRFSSEVGDVLVNQSSQSSVNLILQSAGGGGGHDNIQPSIGMNFIICMRGEFPARN